MLRLALPSAPSGRPAPFLRHHYVTRIDSLHRLPLSAAWSGSTAIRHVTLRRTQARQTAKPWPEAKKNRKATEPTPNTELKFQTRLYQSR
jgi:hypothetical protein